MRRFVRLGAVLFTLATTALVSGLGCTTYEDGTGAEDEDSEDTGTAQVAISQVPSDGSVGCIAVTATGSHSVTQSVDVMPGQGTVLDMNGLPVGTVSFTGNAYQGACASVTSASDPTWISDAVLASVNNVQPVMVSLTMHRSGKADVGVDFEEEPACRASGDPCLSAAECCSQSCVDGSCQSGGPACGPGATLCGAACVNLTSDPFNCGGCGSVCPGGSVCQQGACLMVASCVDAFQNGTETDVDCGGSCPPCATGKSCQASSDCQVGLCLNGTCGECQTAADCPGQDTECQLRFCSAGFCGMQNAPAGLQVSGQSAGNCTVDVCDGSGTVLKVTDSSDVPEDNNPCTIDACFGDIPVHTPAPTGTSCGPDGLVCDGTGNCN